MKIEVKAPYSYAEDISVMFVDEDGDIVDCNHAGAEIEPVEYASPEWYADAHTYAMDGSETLETLICKCGYEKVMEKDYSYCD